MTGLSGDLSVAAVNNGIEMLFRDARMADRARSSGTGGDAEGSDLFEIPGMRLSRRSSSAAGETRDSSQVLEIR